MVKYLLDTDQVVSYLNGRVRAVSLLTSLREEGFAISLITFGEVYEGIYYGRERVMHERGFKHFFRLAPVLPLNRSIMVQYAQIRGYLRRQGQLIGDPDIMIAATAFHHNLTLVTGNVGHFERIPGITLYQHP